MNHTQRARLYAEVALQAKEVQRQAKEGDRQAGQGSALVYRASLIVGVIRGEAARGNDQAAFLALVQLRDLVTPEPDDRERVRRGLVDICAGRWFDYIELSGQCEDWARTTLKLTGTGDLDRKARACAEAFGHPEWCDDPNHPVWQVMRAIAALTEKDHAREEEAQTRTPEVRPTQRR